MAAESWERNASQPSAFRRFRSSPTFILITVWLAIFNDVFLFGTIVPVLPYALPHRIDITYEDVQFWIAILLATYSGALLTGSLVSGWLGDKLPQRHAIFLSGLVTLIPATALLQFGHHVSLLIIGRFLQGLAGAVVWTSSLALLTDAYGEERYGEAVGYAQTAVSFGTTCAPLLGGVVYGKVGYGAVSAMSIGTVATSVVLAILMVEPKAEKTWEEQARGFLTSKFKEHLDHGYANHANSNPTRNGSYPEQSHETSPLLHGQTSNPTKGPAYLSLLGSGRILAAMGGIFAYSFVLINLEGMIPLFVKDTFHWSSTQAALIFLSWIIPGFLGPLAGRASDKFGPKWIAVGGFAFVVTPLICMRFVEKATTSQEVLLCSLLSMVGFGLVWTLPACISDLTAAATIITREKDGGSTEAGASTQAFGLFVFAYSCGSFVGPTVAGVIKAKTNWGVATVVLACTCVLACGPIIWKVPSISPRRQIHAI